MDSFACGECQLHCQSAGELLLHYEQAHSIVVTPGLEPLATSLVEDDDRYWEDHLQCSKCQKVHPNLRARMVHVCPDDRRHVCDVCGHRFAYKANLVRHQKGWCTIGSFPCPLCDTVLIRDDDRDKHVRTEHPGEKPFTCEADGCTKEFGTNQGFRQHMNLCHK